MFGYAGSASSNAVDVFGIAVSAGGAFLRDAAIAAGHDLGIFEALARGGPSSLDDLAGAIGVAAGRRRLRALLDVLAALGAIACDRSTTPRFAAADVSPSRPEVAAAGWGRIAEVIGRDQALSDPDVASPEGARRFHHHLAIAGAEAAGELVAQLGTTSLLDLGAGAGAYTRAFLAARPAGHATLVDTREILGLAAEWLGPLAARARFVAGDASTVAAGDGYGAALLANVLHLHPPAMCARLCTAAARAVAPGGVVVIKDLRIDEDRTGPIEGLLVALNMALYTEAGEVYPTSQLRAWLAEAGLGQITEHRLVAAPDAVVVIARRPPGVTLAPRRGSPAA
ncbi:MAG TPA: methyltransferase [Kofleriaceae bacterium]|nr:methyltransferase [Kofleriaceae bacterium]